MMNSFIYLAIISFIFIEFLSFVYPMIKPGCDEEKLILPFTDKNPMPITALPDALIPRHYTLEFQPFLPPSGNSTFAGNAKISIRCEISTSSITLHSSNLRIFQPTVQVISTKDRSSIPVARVAYDQINEFVVIHLNRALQPKDEYNVSMKYLGWLNNSRYGFLQSSYRDVNVTAEKWIAFAQFKPTGARLAFPCFDEPDLKATFDIIVIRPKALSSISNMPLMRSESRTGGLIADYFNTSKLMSTYMVCFVVSNFTVISGTEGHVKFRVWTRFSSSRLADYTLIVVKTIMTYLENYFKISYPFNHIDLVSIPDFQPAVVGNAGLLAFKEASSLYRNPFTSWAGHQILIQNIAHGLTHQWFGNIVTMNWWNDLWLSEAFATYFADHGCNKYSSDRITLEQFYALHTMVALQKDCLPTTRALSSPVQFTDEIKQMFNSITYHKGAALIRMMVHFLGADVFYKGLRQYVLNNAYLNTVQDDLWYYLNKATKTSRKINVKAVMDTWTLQKGYPVVTVLRNYGAQTATVGQQRFIISNAKISHKRKELWHIPLTFTTQKDLSFGNTKTKFWLPNKNENITLKMENGVPSKDQWMIFNIRAVAYCIVNYDNRNWNLLIDYVKKSQEIKYVNLAQLIHDSFILARGRQLNYAIPLQLAPNILLNEPIHYLSWKAFETAANQLSFKLKYTEIYPQWNKYIVQIVTPTVDRTGVSNAGTHKENLILDVCLELAIKAGKNDTIAQAVVVFKKMKNKTLPIHHDLQKVAACAGIRSEGDSAFQYLLNEYLDTTWPSDKPRLLSYLSCMKNPNHFNRLLDMALNPQSKMRGDDFNQLFSIVSSSIEGKPAAITFIRNKLQNIKTRFQGEATSKITFMLNQVARSFFTAEELRQMKSLVAHVKKELKYEDDFQNAVKTVEANIRWMHDSYEEIKSFLRKRFRF